MVTQADPNTDHHEAEGDPLFLAFKVRDEDYLVPVQSVAEVIQVPKLVPVPDVSPYVLGVINLRGQVVPILDLAIRFGIEGGCDAERPVIIVVVDGDEHLGLLVGGVKSVLAVPADRLDRKPLTERRSTVIDGVATTDQGNFLLIDVSRLVADCRPDTGSAG
jgi:purine-binding chemotaxis protein CheW